MRERYCPLRKCKRWSRGLLNSAFLCYTLKLCISKFWSVKGKPLIFLPPGETGSSWDGVHWGQEQCGLVQPGEQNLLLTFNFVQPCEPNLPLTQPLASCLQMKIFSFQMKIFSFHFKQRWQYNALTGSPWAQPSATIPEFRHNSTREFLIKWICGKDFQRIKLFWLVKV